MGFFYKVYEDIKAINPPAMADSVLDDKAIALASAIADYAGKQWTAIVEGAEGHVEQRNDDDTANKIIRFILDNGSFTEIFRRLSGFVAMVNDMVKPVGGTPDAELQAVQAQQEAFQALDRLLQHLRCNSTYYTREFLAYRTAKTRNLALTGFVNDVLRRMGDELSALAGMPGAQQLPFDVEHPFLDELDVIVPGLRALTDDQIGQLAVSLGATDGAFHLADIVPAVLTDVQVPADGAHLEVARGGCQLPDVPDPAATFGLEAQGTTVTANLRWPPTAFPSRTVS